MDRYNKAEIFVNTKGKRFKGVTRYPEIPLSESDIYVFVNREDRFDNLAHQYYSDPTLWWVISIANESLTQNSYYPPTGAQIRIPTNISSIISQFNALNQI